MPGRFAGIDVSKAELHVCLLRPKKRYRVKCFTNDQSGHRKLLKWLSSYSEEPVHICLESTGRYGQAVALVLWESGHQVSIVNPIRIKGFAASLMCRTKTDRVDAHTIARFCAAVIPAAWTPPPEELKHLQELVRRLAAVERILRQEQNRLESQSCEPVILSVERHIAYLKTEIAQLTSSIDAHFQVNKNLQVQRQLLISIPGLASKTAAILLGELGDISMFESARQLAAYCGLTPRERQSGSSVHKKPCLSRVGNARVRRAIYMPAVSSIRFNPVLREFYLGLVGRGKQKKAAVGAVMRKLLHIVYGVIKHKHPFDPDYARRNV